MQFDRRRMRLEDIAGLQAIDRVAHGEAWSHATFAAQVDDAATRHLVAVGEAGILGHAATWLDGRDLRLINVACAPSAAGRGVASRLLLDLFAGFQAETLSLEVRPSNRRAQRLYGRFGFVPAGVARSFYERRDPTGSLDAVIMIVPDPQSDAWRRRLHTIERRLDAEAAA